MIDTVQTNVVVVDFTLIQRHGSQNPVPEVTEPQ
jgi:hypothetical protein